MGATQQQLANGVIGRTGVAIERIALVEGQIDCREEAIGRMAGGCAMPLASTAARPSAASESNGGRGVLRMGIERKQQVEADLASTVCAFVARGVGVSIVDPFAASAMDRQAVVVRPFKPVIPFEVAVVLPAHRSLSAHAQSFLDLIRIRFREQ